MNRLVYMILLMVGLQCTVLQRKVAQNKPKQRKLMLGGMFKDDKLTEEKFKLEEEITNYEDRIRSMNSKLKRRYTCS